MALETGNNLYWATRLDTKGLQTGAAKSKGILRNLTRTITGMDIFAGLAISAALVFRKITKSAYNFSKDFQSAMKEVQTISDAVKADYEGISDAIMKLSTEGPEGAIKLSKGLYQIVSAGYDGAEAMDILRTSTELAVATVTDTFVAADALTSIMNAYGRAAGTVTEIADKLFTVIKLGKTTMEELGPSITTVTGLAAQLGLNFNDLMAIVAKGVKTLKTDIMMTGIRGILTALIKPTDEARVMAKELGIEWSVAAIKAKGFSQFLKDVMEGTKGNSEALAELFPNVRGLVGVLAVATTAGGKYDDILKKIIESTGNYKEALKIMADTVDFQSKRMENIIKKRLYDPLGEFLIWLKEKWLVVVGSALELLGGPFDEIMTKNLEILIQQKKSLEGYLKVIETLRDRERRTREEVFQLEVAQRKILEIMPWLIPDWEKEKDYYSNKLEVLDKIKWLELDILLLKESQRKEEEKITEDTLTLEKMTNEQAKISYMLRIKQYQKTLPFMKKILDYYIKQDKEAADLLKTEEKITVSREAQAEAQKILNEYLEEEKDYVDEIAKGLIEMGGFIGTFNKDLGESLRILADMTEIIGGWSGLGKIGKAGVIFGVLKGVADVFGLFRRETEKFTYSVELLVDSLREGQDVIGGIYTHAVRMAEGIEIVAAFERQIVQLEYDFLRLQQLYIAKGTDELLKMRDDAEERLKSVRDEYQLILTGTTAKSIADSIADGFAEGKRSIEDFGATFEDIMRKSMLETFKRVIITKHIEDWYKGFVEKYKKVGLEEWGLLRASEIADLRESFAGILAASKFAWDALEDAGIKLSEGIISPISPTGLTGAIAGITEKTAGLLEGQFMAIRVNTVDMLEIMQAATYDIARIADNTEYNRYLIRLESIDSKLSDIRGSMDFERSIM